MTNADDFMIARLDNNNGTIFPRGLRPCRSKISAMDLGEYGILACMLNDGMRGHFDAIFVGWILAIFVIASTLDVSFHHSLPLLLPLPSSYYWYRWWQHPICRLCDL